MAKGPSRFFRVRPGDDTQIDLFLRQSNLQRHVLTVLSRLLQNHVCRQYIKSHYGQRNQPQQFPVIAQAPPGQRLVTPTKAAECMGRVLLHKSIRGQTVLHYCPIPVCRNEAQGESLLYQALEI